MIKKIGKNFWEKSFLFGLLTFVFLLSMTAIYGVVLGNKINLTVATIIIFIAAIMAGIIIKIKIILPPRKNKKRLAAS